MSEKRRVQFSIDGEKRVKKEQKQKSVQSLFQLDWREKYFAGGPLRIGNATQFLFDDYVVEDRYGLKRVVGPVEKHASNPLNTGRPLPWESYRPVLGDVAYDPEEKLYKAWYGFMKDIETQKGIETGYNYSTCYAESQDGITWYKPLGFGYSWCEHEKTNIVLHKERGTAAIKGGVYFDPDASDPEKRFSALAKMVPPGESVRCIVLIHSPDGREWTLAQDPILFRGASDGSYSLVHSPELDCWMLYRRPPTRALKREGFYGGRIMTVNDGETQKGKGANTKRHVSVSLSRDMKTWSHPRTVPLPDEIDVSDIDSVKVIRYCNAFLGFIGLMPNSSPDQPKHTELMWSRDGFCWERLPDRPSFIDNGAPGEWDEGSISFGSLVPEGDRLRIYYTGMNIPQHEKRLPRIRGTGLAFIGKDRWVGQQAGPEGGYLLTRQFIIEGDRLMVNCRCQVKRPATGFGGLIRAELLQEPVEHNPASPYQGFSMEDCDPVEVTDNPEQTMTWNGSPDLSALRGKPVYIRFFLRNATLYTFHMVDRTKSR